MRLIASVTPPTSCKIAKIPWSHVKTNYKFLAPLFDATIRPTFLGSLESPLLARGEEITRDYKARASSRCVLVCINRWDRSPLSTQSPAGAADQLSPTQRQLERQAVLDFARLERRKHFYWEALRHHKLTVELVCVSFRKTVILSQKKGHNQDAEKPQERMNCSQGTYLQIQQFVLLIVFIQLAISRWIPVFPQCSPPENTGTL